MKHIYLIDDEQSLLEALHAVLEDEGYDVTASSNPQLLERLSRNLAPLPDLILLDVFLGDRNGIELAHALRQNKITAAIPIILMSAQPRQAREDAEAVADLFLAKPFDVAVLLDAVEGLTSTTVTV